MSEQVKKKVRASFLFFFQKIQKVCGIIADQILIIYLPPIFVQRCKIKKNIIMYSTNNLLSVFTIPNFQ